MSMSSPSSAVPRHAIIYSHPDPDSFAASVARAYCATVQAQGQSPVVRDLYGINFDPVLKRAERPSKSPFTPAPDVQTELELLAGSDVFVLIYPIWFGTPPAMLKGYIERVLGAGMSFETMRQHPHQPHPLLGGKQLLSFSSSGSTQQWLADQGAWVSLQTIFDGYLARAFWMSSPLHVHFDAIAPDMDKETIQAHLRKVEKQALAMCELLARSRAEPGLRPTPADA